MKVEEIFSKGGCWHGDESEDINIMGIDEAERYYSSLLYTDSYIDILCFFFQYSNVIIANLKS